ncbi:cadmium-translocating P-type ATPase [Acholeplasma equirhinis]|uniref:heavy metal translocating P-type ATPase n=1 Tax=Acholeplasma equirhinis TaxID=555393 RepID=UPI00197AE24D|nr:heavy metal translocating P-type ATPase [Acholeplasma equirhinis]MBN3490162.1 cadmium-translocating P-type ATPase [Acholeplasma equirhinis]
MHTHSHAKPENELLIETIVVSISILLTIVAYIMQNYLSESSPYVVTVYGVAFLLGGFFKAKEGIEETIENKALNVEILMILAAISAFLIGNPSEGALLIMIFAVSGILEGYATNKSKKELTNLLNISPDHATLYKDGEETVVDVSELKVGDQVIVKVGDSIPVDGKIIRGKSSINEAAITGESMPVLKDLNDTVYAGTFNLTSPILIEITTSPEDFVVSKIINLVKDAQENQGKRQSLLSRIEKWYVYSVIALAISWLLIPSSFGWLPWEEAIYRATVVLVVGSPCALMASVAPSMLSALSNAARHRILIKGAYHLETLSTIKAVVMDKTGTITEGTPTVVEFEIDKSYNEKDIYDIVYSMEKLSSHPLASAITSYLEDKATYTPSKVTEEPGHGMTLKLGNNTYKVGKFEYIHSHLLSPKLVTAQEKGYSIVHIILNDQLVGYIALNDNLRPGIKKMIERLKSQGIKPILLTGDNEKTAKTIANLAGIDEVIFNALPHEKKKYVDEVKAKYGPTFMVGDGINDAPALASADIGASMGSGTDLSIETADIIFMNNNLDNIPKLLHLAKENQKIILQNMLFSTLVIFLLLVFNVFIKIPLPFGVVAHEGSTILVILNGLRMLIKK